MKICVITLCFTFHINGHFKTKKKNTYFSMNLSLKKESHLIILLKEIPVRNKNNLILNLEKIFTVKLKKEIKKLYTNQS